MADAAPKKPIVDAHLSMEEIKRIFMLYLLYRKFCKSSSKDCPLCPQYQTQQAGPCCCCCCPQTFCQAPPAATIQTEAAETKPVQFSYPDQVIYT